VLPSKHFDAVEALKALTFHRGTHVMCTGEQAAAMSAALAQDGAAFSLAGLRGGCVLADGGAPAAATLGGVALKTVTTGALHGANPKAAFA
jgi:hypothetical protein